jgi:DNA-binding MarR family transcriptional regulator
VIEQPQPNFDVRLNPVIHAPLRLRICGILSPLEEAEFMVLRDELGVSDSVLSKHLKLLQASGYVLLKKGAKNGRKRAWVQLTYDGRRALDVHIKELMRIAGIIDPLSLRSQKDTGDGVGFTVVNS